MPPGQGCLALGSGEMPGQACVGGQLVFAMELWENPKLCTSSEAHSSEAQLMGLAKESRCQVSLLPQLLCPWTQTPPLGSPKPEKAQAVTSTGKSEGWQSTWEL